MLTLNLNHLKEALFKDEHIVFAYTFGSGKDGKIKDKADLDLALYLNCPLSLDIINNILHASEKATGYVEMDLVILNSLHNIILIHEIITGNLLFTKDRNFLSEFYSISMRKYEDEMLRMAKARRHRVKYYHLA